MFSFNSQHAAGLLQDAHRLHHLPHHQVFLACSDQLVGLLHVSYTAEGEKAMYQINSMTKSAPLTES